MGIQRKKVETFKVSIRTENNFTFLQIITSDEIVRREARVKGKNIELSILEDNDTYIVGLVETNRNDNIPPKKNRSNKSITPLGLTTDEGLAYGNVFLYEKERGILMYEVNKFGCYVDHFVEYLYMCCEQSTVFRNFDINISPVLKSNEYQRMLGMRYHKSVELKIANPRQIIADYTHRNDAIWNACSSAVEIHSLSVQTKFEVPARGNPLGLASRVVREVADRLLVLLRGPQGSNIKKIEIVGYEVDNDDNKLTSIDLIADRFLNFIKLDEPRQNSDLLQRQRHLEITSLYERSITNLNEIFGT